nr:MAG TPA: hypothetical protein [Caudoviricetes sp.]
MNYSEACFIIDLVVKSFTSLCLGIHKNLPDFDTQRCK